MKVFWIWFGLAMATPLVAQEKTGSSDKALTPGSALPELRTKKGEVFYDCVVKRIEEDAVTIQHREGVARVSFFDLDERMQSDQEFDPVAAMKKYKVDRKNLRDLKWRQFWARQKYEAEVAEREEQSKFLQEVKTKWTPVEANVLETAPGGAFVRAKVITFQKTKTKSTLGFEREGPLRKSLVPFKPSVIFITASGISGKIWAGYLEPAASGTRPHPLREFDRVPIYRAVARTDIK